MVEEENPETVLMEDDGHEDEDELITIYEPPKYGLCDYLWAPLKWLKMLAKELHWSFVLGVLIVFGIEQGLGGALTRVGIEYYMKDEQKVQPSEAQIYQGLTSIPWLIKPIWGLLTDVIPMLGYHRRPYFIFSGALGVIPMLYLCFHKHTHIFIAVLSLTIGCTAVAIADVTIDACVAQNSNKHQHLAPDMQSLCSLSASTGALLGFFLSGNLIHFIGPRGVFGLLAIPPALVLLVGITLLEPRTTASFSCKQVGQKFRDATRSMTDTIKLPEVWRPCLYLYLCNTLSLNITDGMFYWYTDSDTGPKFSQQYVGYIFSIGSTGAILGSLLYQYAFKDNPFRGLCFWSQLFLGVSGMLDILLVLRLNLKLGIPDHFFIMFEECTFQFVGRLKYMPLLVLSSKLCPPGIEGTFFALIMSIGNIGGLSSAWLGGFLLHVLNITRTTFDNLWVAILIRNIARLCPLLVISLVPNIDPKLCILPPIVSDSETAESRDDERIKLVSLVANFDRR